MYKTKKKAHGEVERYMTRLVVKGYKQKAGIGYNVIFTPIAWLEIGRLIISLAAQNNWKIHQMNVKSVFSSGVLEEKVYIEQPQGHEIKGEEMKVLKLKKELYVLKQEPRAWNAWTDKYSREGNFAKCPYEHALYIKIHKNEILSVCLYVDDLM